jgi:hypothetical protein
MSRVCSRNMHFTIHSGTASRQFQLSIDRINANIQWSTANIGSISVFFRSNNGSSVPSHRLPSNVAPIHYDPHVKPYLNITVRG